MLYLEYRHPAKIIAKVILSRFEMTQKIHKQIMLLLNQKW